MMSQAGTPPGRLRWLLGHRLSWRTPAWLTIFASLALSLVGISAIDVASGREPSASGLLHGHAMKQGLFVLVGVLACAAVALPHVRWIRAVAWISMWGVIALLVFLLVPFVPNWIVTPRNGVRGWINFGPVDLQPAELAKVAYIAVLADWLRYRENHRTLRGLMPPVVITFVPVALITLQPDLGTAVLLFPVLLAILLAAGARLKHLVSAVLIAALAVPASYPLLKPYQKDRIIGLVRLVQGSDEGADSTNYQAIRALTLAGAGQVEGHPELKSRNLIHFNHLPEAHNDMVFAVILNRHGLMGGLMVLGLYVLWIAGALLTAARSRDPFGRLIVVGCAALIGSQMFINVGMNIGLVPIIGVTLPLVSYGGSSMLTSWIMAGLILSVGLHRAPPMTRESFNFDPYIPEREPLL